MASSYNPLLWKAPSPSSLPSVGFSGYFYYPIKLDFDYHRYNPIQQVYLRIFDFLSSSTTTMQLSILLLMIISTSFLYSTHNGRRYSRFSSQPLRKNTLRQRRGSITKVRQLYDHNILVAVVDIPKHKTGQHTSGKVGSPSFDGLISREKKIWTRDVGYDDQEGIIGMFGQRWKSTKTKLLLVARPPASWFM
ncbi:hypothetical protein BDZ91DRAFT_38992 [Kalaharituber pfeilii]|nr:hypothetical protein BDZ91DRAFT_38992 [Kalaharituber pfeilii]